MSDNLIRKNNMLIFFPVIHGVLIWLSNVEIAYISWEIFVESTLELKNNIENNRFLVVT